MTLREQLEFAERSCSCEAYYRYTCTKCRDQARGQARGITESVDLGYVTWEGYGAPNLTDAGRARLAEFRKG